MEENDIFIRESVFSDLEGGNFIYAMIASLIPIGLGFAYGYALRNKKRIYAYFCMAVILAVDISIGYMLSESIYNKNFEKGLVDDPWELEMIYADLHFWIVIIWNFGLYFAFSWFSNQYFEEKKKISPDFIIQQEITQVKNKIDFIKTKISDLTNVINENKQKIIDMEKEIEKNENSIKQSKDRILSYQTGKIPIDGHFLKQLIPNIMEGYSSYVTGKYSTNKEKSDKVLQLANENKDKWYKEKESTWLDF